MRVADSCSGAHSEHAGVQPYPFRVFWLRTGSSLGARARAADGAGVDGVGVAAVDADERFVVVGRAERVGLVVEALDEPLDGIRAGPHASRLTVRTRDGN